MTILSAIRRPALVALVPLLAGTLALGGCGKSGSDSAPTSTAALPTVPAPAGKTWGDVIEPTEDGMRIGNPEAAIKLIEYGSLTCPHCAKLAGDGFAPLIEKYVGSGRVSLEYRSFAIHPQDVPLTVLVRCADNSAFFALVEQVYANQPAMFERMQAPGTEAKAQAAMKLPPEQRFKAFAEAMGFTEFFAQRGIPKAQADACLAKPDAATKVAEQAEKWGKDGIDSTPTLVLNGSKLAVNTWAELEPLLQGAGAR